MDGTSMSPVTEGQDKHTTLQHGINIAILLGEHESGSHQCIEMSSFVFTLRVVVCLSVMAGSASHSYHVTFIYTVYLYKPPFVCNGKQTKIPEDHRNTLQTNTLQVMPKVHSGTM